MRNTPRYSDHIVDFWICHEGIHLTLGRFPSSKPLIGSLFKMDTVIDRDENSCLMLISLVCHGEILFQFYHSLDHSVSLLNPLLLWEKLISYFESDGLVMHGMFDFPQIYEQQGLWFECKIVLIGLRSSLTRPTMKARCITMSYVAKQVGIYLSILQALHITIEVNVFVFSNSTSSKEMDDLLPRGHPICTRV